MPDSNGPGRFRAIEATMSLNLFGGRRANRLTYKPPSTWNKPSILPERMRANAASSSVGISSGMILRPVVISTLRHARESTPNVRKPRKSIFNRPRSGV